MALSNKMAKLHWNALQNVTQLLRKDLPTQLIDKNLNWINNIFTNCPYKAYLQKSDELYPKQTIRFHAEEGKIVREKTEDINFKDLQLGMNKNAIPSKIKLIKESKISAYDEAFKFTDGNHNKITIYGMSFDVSFMFRDN